MQVDISDLGQLLQNDLPRSGMGYQDPRQRVSHLAGTLHEQRYTGVFLSADQALFLRSHADDRI